MDQNAKQQAVEKLKLANNILVTVSTNPSVDDLSAAIGFSLLLGKLNKHASAVFSGTIPPAIQFLEPDKQLSQDVSSLQDFIIALDKDKADKLRYKVEGNMVRIFITPYRTTITEDDLEFSQGDFNVDAVVALDVAQREDLDMAIKAHGRILHDATVISISSGEKTSNLGAINWADPGASSLCEMLVSITESFGSGLLDQQISTAFLTGIVAATERFSNTKTTPKVMTMAAQLMAAGANQQLIASNLELDHVTPGAGTPPAPSASAPPINDPSQLSISHDDAQNQTPQPQVQTSAPSANDNEVTLPPVQTQPPPSPPPAPAAEQSNDKSLKELEDEISALASSPKASNQPASNQIQPPDTGPAPNLPPSQLADENRTITDSYQSPSNSGGIGIIGRSRGHSPTDETEDPQFGGTFNATSQQAHEESVSDLKRKVNRTILSHPGTRLPDQPELAQTEEPNKNEGYVVSQQPSVPPPMPPAATVQPTAPPTAPPTQEAPTLAVPPPQPPVSPPPAAPAPQPEVQEPSLSDQAQVAGTQEDDVEAARRAVAEAIANQPFDPSGQPITSINAQGVPGDGPGSTIHPNSADNNGSQLQIPS